MIERALKNVPLKPLEISDHSMYKSRTTIVGCFYPKDADYKCSAGLLHTWPWMPVGMQRERTHSRGCMHLQARQYSGPLSSGRMRGQTTWDCWADGLLMDMWTYGHWLDITDLIGFPSIVILVFRFHMLVVLVFPLRLLAGYLYTHLYLFGFLLALCSIYTWTLCSAHHRFVSLRGGVSTLYALCLMLYAYPLHLVLTRVRSY